MAKVRLVKGPFAGKVMESGQPNGVTHVQLVGPKPMSRRQRYDWLRNSSQSFSYGLEPRFPQVRAEYRIAMTYYNGQSIPCRHPDGSYFYEFVQGTKKEY